MSDAGARRAARAIDALRRGWPFRVSGENGALDLLAVESAGDAALAAFAGGAADLLISGERAGWPGPPMTSPPRSRSPTRRSTSLIR